jgi:hypothetical protein
VHHLFGSIERTGRGRIDLCCCEANFAIRFNVHTSLAYGYLALTSAEVVHLCYWLRFEMMCRLKTLAANVDEISMSIWQARLFAQATLLKLQQR